MILGDFIQKKHYRFIDSYSNSVMDFEVNNGVTRCIFIECGLSPLPNGGI